MKRGRVKCVECGHAYIRDVPRQSAPRCRQCYFAFRKRNPHRFPNWKGGRLMRDGYVFVKKPNHPNALPNGYIAEHRLVMSRHLGRPLKRSELVHHKNETRSDNRIRNLQLCNHSTHMALHKSKAVCRVCGKPQRCKGLCGKHYERAMSKKMKCRKCGKRIRKDKRAKCKVCRKCYHKQRRLKAAASPCKICRGKHFAFGLCIVHYRIQIRNPRRRAA